MMKNNFFIFFIIFMLFTGCSSLPKNVTQEEYDSVRDFVSMDVSGMTYLELLKRFDREQTPKYTTKGWLGPHYEEGYDSRYTEYNEYLMSISNRMNVLTSEYKKTDQVERFYTWAVSYYKNNKKDDLEIM